MDCFCTSPAQGYDQICNPGTWLWLAIKPTALWCVGWHSNRWAIPDNWLFHNYAIPGSKNNGGAEKTIIMHIVMNIWVMKWQECVLCPLGYWFSYSRFLGTPGGVSFSSLTEVTGFLLQMIEVFPDLVALLFHTPTASQPFLQSEEIGKESESFVVISRSWKNREWAHQITNIPLPQSFLIGKNVLFYNLANMLQIWDPTTLFIERIIKNQYFCSKFFRELI